MLFVKKMATLLSFILLILCVNGCSLNQANTSSGENKASYENNFHCERCNDLIDDDYVETTDLGRVCFSCVVYKNYIECQNCNHYFIFEAGKNTLRYCENCVESCASGCYLCWAWPLDYNELVKHYVHDEEQYICTDCSSEYFTNIEYMTPCWYCIECGKLFKSNPYPHYLYDDTEICGDCIKTKGFQQCNLCKKYFDEGDNGICGYCIAEKN